MSPSPLPAPPGADPAAAGLEPRFAPWHDEDLPASVPAAPPAPRVTNRAPAGAPSYGTPSYGAPSYGTPAPYGAPYLPPRAGAPARRPARADWPAAVWPPEVPNAADAADDEPAFDLAQLRTLAGYPWRAVRRRRRLAWGVFAAVCGAALLALVLTPRRYDVETSLLAQRNFVMPALGNPRRAVPAESDAPTRLAAEAVLNRDNLVGLIDETGLEAAWPRLRSPAGRAKEALQGLTHRAPDAAERQEQLVGYLRSRLWVLTDEGTVHIGVHFPDGPLALRLVQAAQRRFLAARHASEVALINESIGILEGHVQTAHAQIEAALADVRRLTPAERAVPALAPAFAPAPRRPAAPAPGLVALQDELTAKRAAIGAAEAARAQRVGALEARLAELRRTLGSAHPAVVETQAGLAALATEPPELATMRADARALAARVAAAGGAASAAAPDPARGDAALALAVARLSARPAADTLEDPQLTYARSRLKIAVADHEDLLDRLESARIELETARAAFKYRYSVITPATLPDGPAAPRVPILLVGGLVAGVALAVFAAVAVDLGGGRVAEPWQVDRLVGLPVLGELPRP